VTACFVEKSDLFHRCEKDLESAMIDINDFWTIVIGNEPLEKPYLIANIRNVGDRRQMRQIIRQLGLVVAEVECCHGSITEHIKLGEQSRYQSPSATPTWGANDIERSSLAAHATFPLWCLAGLY
jgi:hypothetical protein